MPEYMAGKPPHSSMSHSAINMIEPHPAVTEGVKSLVVWVEATDNEAHQLWAKYHNRVDWKEDCSGLMVQVGSFADMPISFTISFAEIGGKRIGFWHGVSMIVHYDMIATWMDTHTKDVPKMNANNFHNVLHELGVTPGPNSESTSGKSMLRTALDQISIPILLTVPYATAIPDALKASWEAESTRRQSEAAIGTLGRSRLWHRLDGDAHSYNRSRHDVRESGYFHIKLNPFGGETPDDCTEGQMVASYVTTMLPELTPSDWWWRKASDGRFEVCIQSVKVDEING